MTGRSPFTSMRQDPPFRVEIDPGNTSVAAFGELDMATVDELDAALQQALNGGPRRLVLDLRGLTFMGAQGLHLVTRWSSVTEKCGTAFAIIQGGRAVRRLFEIAGLLDRLPFADTVDDAPAASARETVLPEADSLRVAEPTLHYPTAVAPDVVSGAYVTGSSVFRSRLI